MALLLFFTATATAMDCPAGIGSQNGDRPKLSDKTPQGPELVVCGDDSHEEAPGSGIYRMSEFDVFAYGFSHTPDKIFEAGALEPYRVWIDKDKGLALQKELAGGAARINSVITCTQSSCTRGMETCERAAQNYPRPDAVKRLRERLKSGSDQQPAPLDTLVEDLAVAAVRGDQKAAEFLESDDLGGRLDGSAAEARTEGIQTIATLKRLNCLQ